MDHTTANLCVSCLRCRHNRCLLLHTHTHTHTPHLPRRGRVVVVVVIVSALCASIIDTTTNAMPIGSVGGVDSVWVGVGGCGWVLSLWLLSPRSLMCVIVITATILSLQWSPSPPPYVCGCVVVVAATCCAWSSMVEWWIITTRVVYEASNSHPHPHPHGHCHPH